MIGQMITILFLELVKLDPFALVATCRKVTSVLPKSHIYYESVKFVVKT